MKVTNVRATAREIAESGQVAGPGETIEVDNDLGQRLLAQPHNWQAVKAAEKGDS